MSHNPSVLLPARWLGTILALAALCAACGGAGPSIPARLELERLAFVPHGRTTPFANLRIEVPRDLLVDRFEVTRESWRSVGRRPGSGLPDPDRMLGFQGADTDQLPVTGMTLGEARHFAQLRDMRLPTVGEWMYVAGGSRAQYWPYWGTQPGKSVANTAEVGLDKPVAVGTFPNGRTSDTGVHDMLGNVWEWTETPLPPGVEPSSWWLAGPSPWSHWAMGGSYLTPARPLFGLGVLGQRRVFHARGIEPDERASDVGLRCCVDAEAYLELNAAAWSRAALRDRLIAVGRQWGARAVPLLERLVSGEDAPAALAWLLEGARS